MSRCPFSAASQKAVEATVPILEAGGQVLTSAFYKRMFSHDPEVLAFFNQAHQAKGAQPRALATSVLAYAKNLENLGALGDAIELIAQKHVALDIKAEHYPIVGRNLLAAMVEVLGADVATKEVIDGWTEAYGFLADVLIAREAQIYKELETQPHGWIGKRKFELVSKTRKSDDVCSFVFKPVDGNPLPAHKAGQYTTIYASETLDGPRPIAPRQYSISSAPGSGDIRITVKREGSGEGHPAGIYSNWLHDVVKVGDQVDLGPAVGNFTLDEEAIKTRPAVFLAGGVGLTPLVPCVHQANRVAPEQKLFWLYSARNSDAHPEIEEEVEALAKSNANIKTVVAYDAAKPTDTPDILGRLTPKGVLTLTGLPADAFDVYICGPIPFMANMVKGLKEAGVPDARIHFEAFGPQLGAF